jgi:hypothetical protein
MESPAPVDSPDQTQTPNPASMLWGFLNGLGFQVVVTLLGIVRAFM